MSAEQKEKRGRGRPPKNTEKTLGKTVYLTPQQHKTLRLLAAEQDTDVSSIIRKAINEFFENHKL